MSYGLKPLEKEKIESLDSSPFSVMIKILNNGSIQSSFRSEGGFKETGSLKDSTNLINRLTAAAKSRKELSSSILNNFDEVALLIVRPKVNYQEVAALITKMKTIGFNQTGVRIGDKYYWVFDGDDAKSLSANSIKVRGGFSLTENGDVLGNKPTTKDLMVKTVSEQVKELRGDALIQIKAGANKSFEDISELIANLYENSPLKNSSENSTALNHKNVYAESSIANTNINSSSS